MNLVGLKAMGPCEDVIHGRVLHAGQDLIKDNFQVHIALGRVTVLKEQGFTIGSVL